MDNDVYYFGIAGILLVIAAIVKRPNRQPLPSSGKLVVVTGCDSGFGEGIARRMHSLGYTVVATCLNPDTAPIRTETDKTLYTIKVNVLNSEDVKNLYSFCLKICEERDVCLWALVNNAGFGWGSLFEMMKYDDFRSIFEVNFFAPVRLCQLFLPIIRQTGGRIVNMASGSALIPVPNMTAYSSSKASLYHFSRALQVELSQFGVRVISICPWYFRTGIVESSIAKVESVWKAADEEVYESYGGEESEKKSLGNARKVMDVWDTDLSPVIDAVVASLTEVNPRPLYVPGSSVLTGLSWIINALPSRIAEELLHRFLPPL